MLVLARKFTQDHERCARTWICRDQLQLEQHFLKGGTLQSPFYYLELERSFFNEIYEGKLGSYDRYYIKPGIHIDFCPG